MAQEVITAQRSKGPDLARYIVEPLVLGTDHVRQAIRGAKLPDFSQ